MKGYGHSGGTKIRAGVYLTFALLFHYSTNEKLIDDSGTMPPGLVQELPGHIHLLVPGTDDHRTA